MDAVVFHGNKFEMIMSNLIISSKKNSNKKLINSYTAKRRAQKINATPKWASLKAIQDMYQNCPAGYHVDHIIPLNNDFVCGLHVIENLQYLLIEENLKKSNKFDMMNKEAYVQENFKKNQR